MYVLQINRRTYINFDLFNNIERDDNDRDPFLDGI